MQILLLPKVWMHSCHCFDNLRLTSCCTIVVALACSCARSALTKRRVKSDRLKQRRVVESAERKVQKLHSDREQTSCFVLGSSSSSSMTRSMGALLPPALEGMLVAMTPLKDHAAVRSSPEGILRGCQHPIAAADDR